VVCTVNIYKRGVFEKMKTFAVFLPMLDIQKSQSFREKHLEFLENNRRAGKIFANGRFLDGAGGLVIYLEESLKAVTEIVKQDPYVINRARGYEIHEWEIVTEARLP
jgi:uncharacterized protein YciI